MTLRPRTLSRLLGASAALCAAFCVIAPTAFAAGAAPTAITGGLSTIAATTVTVTGTVDPNGAATTWLFEYGTTASYGSETSVQNVSSGTTDTLVSTTLSGLIPDTVYYYRLDATNPTGTTDGTGDVFVTPASSTAVTDAATALTETTASLNGSVNPSGLASSYYFEYGTSTAYGQVTATTSGGAGTTSVPVTATLSGLTAASTYHFRLVVTNTSGTVYGADESFTTISGVAPLVETGSAEAPGATTVTLTGSVNPEGSSTTWIFEYGATSAYGSTTSSVSAASGKTAISVTSALAKLLPDTTYHYRIVATNATGSSDGEDVTFTTPAAVTLLAAEPRTIDGRDVVLSGTVAGAGVGVRVSVLAMPAGNSAFVAVANITTITGGAWSYRSAPTVTTAYRAETSSGSSSEVTIGVSPAITLRRITSSRLLIQVVASTPLDGKTISLQRLEADGLWRTVHLATLGAHGSAIISQTLLPLGASTVRVAMAAREAGTGYLSGYSRTIAGVEH